MSVMHVKIKATREELHELGICSEPTFELLLSGRAFEVDKRVHVGGPNGSRVMVYLKNPEKPSHMIWVWENMTSEVPR